MMGVTPRFGTKELTVALETVTVEGCIYSCASIASPEEAGWLVDFIEILAGLVAVPTRGESWNLPPPNP